VKQNVSFVFCFFTFLAEKLRKVIKDPETAMHYARQKETFVKEFERQGGQTILKQEQKVVLQKVRKMQELYFSVPLMEDVNFEKYHSTF
jgi:hypothetical protein